MFRALNTLYLSTELTELTEGLLLNKSTPPVCGMGCFALLVSTAKGAALNKSTGGGGFATVAGWDGNFIPPVNISAELLDVLNMSILDAGALNGICPKLSGTADGLTLVSDAPLFEMAAKLSSNALIGLAVGANTDELIDAADKDAGSNELSNPKF